MLSWNFDRIEVLSKFITPSAKNVGFMGKGNDYTSGSYNPEFEGSGRRKGINYLMGIM